MKQQTGYLYVFDTLSDWEPGYAIAGLNNPAYQKAPGHYTVKTVGPSLEPIKSIGGLTILPDLSVEDLTPDKSSMLILPGGAGWEAGQHDQVVEKAKEFLCVNVSVAAICGATAGLARAGLLDKVKHTGNAQIYLQWTNYPGAALYQDAPAVTDGDVITTGAMAPIEFAYHIFKKLGIYTDPLLEAWYGLYKTGDPIYFYELQKLSGGD